MNIMEVMSDVGQWVESNTSFFCTRKRSDSLGRFRPVAPFRDRGTMGVHTKARESGGSDDVLQPMSPPSSGTNATRRHFFPSPGVGGTQGSVQGAALVRVCVRV
jgi:hypothetical protein